MSYETFTEMTYYETFTELVLEHQRSPSDDTKDRLTKIFKEIVRSTLMIIGRIEHVEYLEKVCNEKCFSKINGFDPVRNGNAFNHFCNIIFDKLRVELRALIS